MASGVRRGSDGKAAFEVHKDRHATNVEVLTDVAVLSSADARGARAGGGCGAGAWLAGAPRWGQPGWY